MGLALTIAGAALYIHPTVFPSIVGLILMAIGVILAAVGK